MRVQHTSGRAIKTQRKRAWNIQTIKLAPKMAGVQERLKVGLRTKNTRGKKKIGAPFPIDGPSGAGEDRLMKVLGNTGIRQRKGDSKNCDERRQETREYSSRIRELRVVRKRVARK